MGRPAPISSPAPYCPLDGSVETTTEVSNEAPLSGASVSAIRGASLSCLQAITGTCRAISCPACSTSAIVSALGRTATRCGFPGPTLVSFCVNGASVSHRTTPVRSDVVVLLGRGVGRRRRVAVFSEVELGLGRTGSVTLAVVGFALASGVVSLVSYVSCLGLCFHSQACTTLICPTKGLGISCHTNALSLASRRRGPFSGACNAVTRPEAMDSTHRYSLRATRLDGVAISMRTAGVR